MDVQATLATTSSPGTESVSKKGLGTMAPEDFLQILIKQLQYQDPMEPMDNEQLLGQISEIRSMEMSVTLTDALKNLTDQQRIGSAASMIGQYVTGTLTAKDGSETTLAGMVRGIRFKDGEPILELDRGVTLPLKDLTDVTEPSRLVGKYVAGVVLTEENEPMGMEGIVTAVGFADNGEAILQLATGAELPLSGLQNVTELSQLVGKYVQGAVPTGDGQATRVTGKVTEVQFTDAGEVLLALDTGGVLPAAYLLSVSAAPNAQDGGNG